MSPLELDQIFEKTNLQFISNPFLVDRQKVGSGWVQILLFRVGSGSGIKMSGILPSGFGFLGVKVKVGLGSSSTFRGWVGDTPLGFSGLQLHHYSQQRKLYTCLRNLLRCRRQENKAPRRDWLVYEKKMAEFNR